MGQIVGGALGQLLYNRHKSSQCYLMGFSTILSAPPMLYLLNTDDPGSVAFYFAAVFSGLVVRYVIYDIYIINIFSCIYTHLYIYNDMCVYTLSYFIYHIYVYSLFMYILYICTYHIQYDRAQCAICTTGES